MAAVTLTQTGQSDNPMMPAFKQVVRLDDALVPFPLHQIWQEMIVSQTLLSRFADGEMSAWHTMNPGHDPLAISNKLAEHSQTLLVMGHDDASGQLSWQNDELKPDWQRTQGDYFERLNDTLFEGQQRVFDGGLFSPNLISQPVPEGFAGIVEGADALQGNLLSVHPLGGCCMAESVNDGVVNTQGQVFRYDNAQTDAGAVYKNLYVLDGSIIPGAIGTNPMLTIASLSYALASEICLSPLCSQQEQSVDPLHIKTDHHSFPPLTMFREIPVGVRWPVPDVSARRFEAQFNERLVCHLDTRKRSFFSWSATAAPSLSDVQRLLPDVQLPSDIKALVLDVSVAFSGEQSLDQWIQHPHEGLKASAIVNADTVGGVFTTPDSNLVKLADLSGKVFLGVADQHPPSTIRQWLRVLAAVFRFLRYRSIDLLVKLPSQLQSFLLSEQSWRNRQDALAKTSDKTRIQQIRDFLRIARLQSQPRYLRYEFGTQQCLLLTGKKTLAYSIVLPDLLKALMVLPVKAQNRQGFSKRITFEIDAVRVSNGPSALQITSSPDTPSSVMAASGVAMYFLRLIMNTHFWSFAAPAYKQFAQRQDIERTAGQGRFAAPPAFIYYGPGGKKQSLAREKYEQSNGHAGRPQPLSRLIRYQPSDDSSGNRQTLLLIHGLAHSSRVFWTDTIACNFVQYFLARNYDVWVLDHRASANYVTDINPDDRWDDIALVDVPWAVKTIFNQVNQLATPGEERHIHVFSHCIGAGAAAMAVLAGKLDYEQRLPDGSFIRRSMLASLVPHAVTPWLHASAENRARANVWAWFKELEPIQTIEPLPHKNPAFLETVYDRLAALAMTSDERKQWSSVRGFFDWRGPGFAQSIYTRYTIFWGRQWFNKNLARATREEFAGMIGPVPIGVMQQVYFSMTRGLLSNHEGANAYVRESAFHQHWQFPTLFLHGNRNTVFDKESSRQSADQLTRLRRFNETGKPCTDELLPEDYAAHRVWIEVLNDYGHMDMIFSKRASLEVYPRLHEFFEAAVEDDLRRFAQKRLSSTAARDWFMNNCRASAQDPVQQCVASAPRMGPIISSPQLTPEGRVSIRVWVEAEDFQVYPAKGVSVKSDASQVTTKHVAYKIDSRQGGALDPVNFRFDESTLWRHEFWLHDLEFPSTADGRFGFSLDYGKLTQAGSCLYPGLPFDRHGAFSAFAGMRLHLTEGAASDLRGVDGLILLGDQIYAEATADLFDPRSLYERYRNAYRLAFAHPDVAYVFAHLATWLVLDDHEFKDNWRGEYDETMKYARRMAGLYQMHQRPHWDTEAADLWYHFQCAGYPAFVFDTRSDSHAADKPSTDVLGPKQMQAFENWLIKQSQSPVILLCSESPIGPVERDLVAFPDKLRREDGLLAYPGFLAKVATLLLQHTPDARVIWLTGDPHLSCVVELCATSAKGTVVITQLCCSGLNAPLPFVNAQAAAYDWDTSFGLLLDNGEDAIQWTGRQLLLTDNPRHFVRLDIDPDDGNQLTVQAYAADGSTSGRAYKSSLVVTGH